MKRYFIVKSITHYGEYEDYNQSTLCRDIPLGKQPKEIMFKNFANRMHSHESDLSDVEYRGYKEISKNDFEVLQKYSI